MKIRIRKMYSKKEYIGLVKRDMEDLGRKGMKNMGKIIFYLQTCIFYKSASKKLKNYPL